MFNFFKKKSSVKENNTVVIKLLEKIMSCKDSKYNTLKKINRLEVSNSNNRGKLTYKEEQDNLNKLKFLYEDYRKHEIIEREFNDFYKKIKEDGI